MAERVRAHDWSATRLGPMADWPAALRAATATVLRAGFPTMLLAGDDLLHCAYNDAYAALLGDMRPALGRPAVEVWRDAYETVGPQLAAVRRGETLVFRELLLRIDRGAGPRDAWFDYSLSPVLDEAGRVIAVQGVGVEATERVLERMAHETAETARREREAMFETALEAAEAGWVALDPATGGATLDARARAMVGLPPEPAPVGLEAWRARIHPDDRPAIAEKRRLAAARGAECDCRFRVVRPDGEIRHVRGRIWPRAADPDRGARMSGLIFDETDKHRDEADRKERETLLDLALEAAEGARIEHDLVSGRRKWSEGARRIFGVAPAAPDPDPEAWLAMVHPDDRAQVRAEVEEGFRRGGALRLRYRAIGADGALRHVRDVNFVAHDRLGRPVRVTALIFDETGARRAEAERREREALLQLALDAAQAGWIVTKEPDGAGEFDGRARRILGLADEPAAPTLADMLARIHPEDRGRLLEEIAGFGARGGPYELRYRVLREGGGVHHIVERGFAGPDARGRGGRFSGLVFDETEGVRREAQRDLMIRELNHRVKNMFAVVQSIAGETFRNEIAAETAIATFEERLGALAAAHDLLVRDDLDGAELRSLIAAVAHISARAERIALSGPFVSVGSQRAIGLTMAFHELYTNAVKYGALSNATGRVAVSWSLDPGAPPRLSLLWRETGGPRVTPPRRRGFGSFMVEEALAAEFDEVALDFRPEGLVCRIAADWPGEGDG